MIIFYYFWKSYSGTSFRLRGLRTALGFGGGFAGSMNVQKAGAGREPEIEDDGPTGPGGPWGPWMP